MLETERLRLRALELEDAGRVRELAGAYEVASTTLNIPHPYPEGAAEDFIYWARRQMNRAEGYHYAVTVKPDTALIGVISLTLQREHRRGELGYWIGVPYWNQGYATESARRLVRFGFEELELVRIYATCYPLNLASARVMQKAGMIYEGTLRHHVMHFGSPRDAAVYGILREEWQT
jgi:RimJ/RimL family protein N-acetyltransferase